MQLPLQITFRDIPQTQALTSIIEKKAHKLEQFYHRIMSCRVAVEVPQKHQHNGKVFSVRIDITVPQDEIVINKIKNEDIYVAIRDAFNAARRKLHNYASKQRGEIKNHNPMTHGVVVRIFPEEEYGFIRAFDGREFYFHKNNIAYPEFDKLEIGTEVQFIETVAGEGYQANRVTAGKHQPLAGKLET